MAMSTLVLRRSILFAPPLVLGLLEIGHPALLPGDDIVATIAPIAGWWTALHVVQVPLFALLGAAVFLLVRDLDGRAAAISRSAIAVFIVGYPAFDAAVGIASGVLILTAASAALEPGLQNLFWGPVTGMMAIVASASWLIALVSAAWAWRKHGAPGSAVIFLGLSGLLLGIAHIRPLGPLACLCFLIGAALIEFRSRGSKPVIAGSQSSASSR
jgi:hypothetical protein